LLDCPRQCASACSACLCDYSNQIFWDSFDRHPVRAWLLALTGTEELDPFVKAGGVRVSRPSLARLTAGLGGISPIHLLAKDLISAAGEGHEGLRWLLERLNAGIKISVHLQQELDLRPAKLGARQRQVLLHLYPYIETGQLRVDRILAPEEAEERFRPRIFGGAEVGAPAWISGQPQTALLDNLLPTPLYRFTLDQTHAEWLQRLIAGARPCLASSFQVGLPMERWEFQAGEPRDLGKLFSAIDGAYIQDAVVRDPYCCASDAQRAALKAVLRHLLSSAARIEQLAVHCRELGRQDDRYQELQEGDPRLADLAVVGELEDRGALRPPAR
jgi:hypothetical protein